MAHEQVLDNQHLTLVAGDRDTPVTNYLRQLSGHQGHDHPVALVATTALCARDQPRVGRHVLHAVTLPPRLPWMRPTPQLRSMVYQPKKRIRLKTPRRREQCRVNQARYRQKQIARDAALVASVERIRAEVTELMARRQRLRGQSTPPPPNPRHTLVALFDIFRHGLAPLGEQCHPSRTQQLAFVASAVHGNVRVGEGLGRQAMLDQLEHMSQVFADPLVLLCRIDDAHADGSTTTLHQSIRVELTITTHTIQRMLPLFAMPSNWRLQQKLVGQRLVGDVLGVTVFDANGQIIDISWTVDVLSALGELLTIQETVEVIQSVWSEPGAAPKPRTLHGHHAESSSSADWSRGRHRYLSGQRFAHLATLV